MRMFITLILAMVGYQLLAQNLVQNPSFEHYVTCPNDLGTFKHDIEHWNTPTIGSADYFNECSEVMGIRNNFNGGQQPKNGKGYAGIYFYAPSNYREYIQGKLIQPLEKGQEYVFSYYASLAEASHYAIKDFGVAFSNVEIKIATTKALSRGDLFRKKIDFQLFEVNQEEFYVDTTSWFKVSISFMAKGHEKYFALGNFRDDNSTAKIKVKRNGIKKGCYYYLDKVALVKKGEEPHFDGEYKKDKLYVFKNINFDFDKFSVTQKGMHEIGLISNVLQEDKSLILQIHGHTDDQGSKNYNQSLSEKRANAVVNLFVQSGIPRERIMWFGHGNSKPMVNKIDQKSRAINRRVEFMLQAIDNQ